MKKFITDILRDKGSTKYSITKSIAIIVTFTLLGYIGHTLYQGNEFDQFLIGQLILMILTLTGFKNNFGINKTHKTEEKTVETTIDMQSEPTKNDEGEF